MNMQNKGEFEPKREFNVYTHLFPTFSTYKIRLGGEKIKRNKRKKEKILNAF